MASGRHAGKRIDPPVGSWRWRKMRRRRVRRAVRGPIGALTSGHRLRPGFVVVGAMKAGTSALFSYLGEQPGIAVTFKEIHFFDHKFGRGARWYFGHFPLRARAARERGGLEPMTGEASPDYLSHPLAPGRIRSVLPDVKLIAILRDPVDRALSHYVHTVAFGREPLPFEEAIEAESERLRGQYELLASRQVEVSFPYRYYSYLTWGRYAEQLERWFEVFPREQMLILSSSDLAREPARVVSDVCEFLGIASRDLGTYPRKHERTYEPMKFETRERLARYFEEPNQQLYDLLGRDFGWTRPAGSAR